MGVDDLELDREGTSPPTSTSPRASTRAWIIGGVVVLAVLAGGVARWWTMRGPAPAPAPEAPAAATEVPLPAETVVLPPLEQMDPFLRGLLGALSARPELARWLATDGLIQQMAAAIDRVSRGASPASDLRVLAPDREFLTTRRGRSREVDSASYARYDGIAATLAGMDPAAVARIYRTIRPRLDEAYKAMGRADSDVDVAVQRALEVLVATPIPEGPIRVVEGRGATWAFADPALEALDPAQKQLLRMGPDNAARVIDTLRRIQQQLAS
ncbi:MAG: DUF3014 domain-containing protein [Acidobacteria bacterium]|nr:DUF3014 domain-containing protein [Acidobacteriota bacterium]